MKKNRVPVSSIIRAVIVLLLTTLTACATASPDDAHNIGIDLKKGKLSRLVPLIGTYRFEQVFEDSHVKQAIRELLGNDLPYLLVGVDVRDVIEFRGSDIVLRWHHAHEAHRERAILVVNIYDGRAHAGILSEGSMTIYSEENAYLALPAPIREWIWFNSYSKLLETSPTKNFAWLPQGRIRKHRPAAPVPAGTRVDLKYPAGGETSPYANLLADLKDRLQRSIPGMDVFRRRPLFVYGLVDLNGDGVDEILVRGVSSYWCGNRPTCNASVYTPKDGGWRYIGDVPVRDGHYPAIAYAIVEDLFHNGWRVINDGEMRHCWVADPEKSGIIVSKDAYLMPRDAGEPGYYWSIQMKEPCPDK